MALVFQTWTLCITCTTMITVHSYIREKLLFLLETKSLTPNEVNGRHCVIKVQHTHTRFFINGTTGTWAERKKLLFSSKMRSKEEQKRRKLPFLPRRKTYAYVLKETPHRHATHAIRGRTEWRHVS